MRNKPDPSDREEQEQARTAYGNIEKQSGNVQLSARSKAEKIRPSPPERHVAWTVRLERRQQTGQNENVLDRNVLSDRDTNQGFLFRHLGPFVFKIDRGGN